MIRAGILLLTLLAGSIEASIHSTVEGAKGTSIDMDVLKEQVVIGENVEVSVTLHYPKGYTPSIESLARSLLDYFGPMTPPFRLQSTQISPDEVSLELQPRVKKKIVFTLSPQRVGSFPLSLLKVVFVPADPKVGDPLELVTDVFTVKVEAAPKSDLDPLTLMAPVFPLNRPYILAGLEPNRGKLSNQDIIDLNQKAIQSRSFPWKFILSCAVMVAVFWLIRYAAPKDLWKEPEPVDIEGERKRALDDLKLIAADGVQQEEIGAIDAVVRHYFEEAMKIRAPHQTSQEFLGNLAKTGQYDQETVQGMARLLGQIDMVKYARVQIPSQQAQKLASIATQIISTIGK